MEIVFIPVGILNKMALWLSEQQNEDGAFVETSEYYYDRSFLVTTSDHANFYLFYALKLMIW